MHWIDPSCLPEKKGVVKQFLINPHGHLDGMIIGRNQVVHFPPHLAAEVARNIRVGESVKVRGVKPRNADLIAAVSLTAANGKTILDNGPEHGKHGAKPERPASRPGSVSGTVVALLHGPKGELRGALLDDGTSLRMAPHAAEELADYLAPGMHLQAWGDMVKNKFGKTVDVAEIADLGAGA